MLQSGYAWALLVLIAINTHNQLLSGIHRLLLLTPTGNHH